MASLRKPGNVECNLLRHLPLDRVDHRNGAADLRRYPHFGIVTLELGEARARIDQNVGDDLARLGVDEMRHVGRLGSIDQDFAVRADGHALRLDADLDLAEAGALLDVDDRHRVVVFVGDVEDLAVSIEGEQFGVRAGGQGIDHLLLRNVDDLNAVVVADGHEHKLSVPRELDAARPLADLDGLGDGPTVRIDHRYGVALLVGDIGDEGRGGARRREPDSHSGKQAMTPHTQSILLHCSLHLVSGRSTPSVSSSDTWCKNPSCGETETTMRPSTSRIG